MSSDSTTTSTATQTDTTGKMPETPLAMVLNEWRLERHEASQAYRRYELHELRNQLLTAERRMRMEMERGMNDW